MTTEELVGELPTDLARVPSSHSPRLRLGSNKGPIRSPASIWPEVVPSSQCALSPVLYGLYLSPCRGAPWLCLWGQAERDEHLSSGWEGAPWSPCQLGMVGLPAEAGVAPFSTLAPCRSQRQLPNRGTLHISAVPPVGPSPRRFLEIQVSH